jgi:ribosomal protein L11 methyltransferase
VIRRLTDENPGRIVLSFPPQLAFGTGSHPTTAGCLRFLSDFSKSRRGLPWSVLDLGCGSGILAIAAAKLGATRVVAVENDGMALIYARENAERHGVADVVDFVEGDAIALMEAEPENPYDLIAANLFSDLLEVLFPRFPAHLAVNGELIVSGFLATQCESVSRHAAAAGLPLAGTVRRGKWMAGRAPA